MNKVFYFSIILFLFFTSCDTNDVELDNTASFIAKFSFEKNLATTFGQSIPLTFEVKNKQIQKIELYLQDSLLETWKNPKGKLNYILDTKNYTLGSYQLQLKSYFASDESFYDTRLLRILSDVQPIELNANILNIYPHNETHFTQGLEFDGDNLYESIGDPNDTGASKLMLVDLKSGKVIKEMGQERPIFAEGLTILGDKIFQLTYKNQKCLVYDKNSLQLLNEFVYSGEGWGLCNDGKYIIMSNGTEYLTFRDPSTFQIVKTIQVYDPLGPRIQLNELEYIEGKIWANIWMLDLLLEIDPINGKVLKEMNCNTVSSKGKGSGDVLNGIAFHQKTKHIYLTGKYWKNIFQVKFEEKKSL
ncbi:MAG: glutaminyl-peptide cyclotransferase [Flavobacteriia bacterium]|nr:glutaminyl-peptide cyclotransferase [Flavobacteriia bacterium]